MGITSYSPRCGFAAVLRLAGGGSKHKKEASSVLAWQVDRERESAHKYEAERPGCIEIEPTPRHELETQIAVDNPRQRSPGCDHRDRVDYGNHDGHAKTGIDEGACRRIAPIKVGGAAESKIDRYQHQSRAMRDRHGQGPQPQFCRSYPRQHSRMPPVDQPEDAEPDDQ